MPFEIRPIVKPEVDTVTKLIYAAYQESPVSELWYGVPASQSVIEASAKISLEGWGKTPNERHMQVKDTETGEMISAVTVFFIPQREGDDWVKAPEFKCPDEYNKEIFSRHLTEIFHKRNETMGAQPYLCKF